MPYSFEHDLWDKQNAIILHNDKNTTVMEKFQKFIVDYCKNQLLSILNQKRSFEKFLSEIEDQKNSEFSFYRCSYFFIERLLEVLNIHETFNEILLKEVDEIAKSKFLSIKKETKSLKNQKKKMLEDFMKENQKHDIEFKRYCTRHNVKDAAYTSYLKAEENKSLSRNQVDHHHNMFLNRKAEFDQSKLDYLAVLDNFNKYQLNHYSVQIPEWSKAGEEIERNRYNVLRTTFTNLSELCRSLASKANEIADKIESQSDMINCEEDCETLVNKEKTGDIPPGPISFKDFDITETELDLNNQDNDKQREKVSSSSSDSVSMTNGKSKRSLNGAPKKSDSKNHKNASLNTSASSTSSNSSNGIVISGTKIFTKLFVGVKKTVDSSNKNVNNEIERLEELLEEKFSMGEDNNDKEEIDEIKNKLKSLKTETVKPTYRTSIFQSMRSRPFKRSPNKGADKPTDNNEQQLKTDQEIGNAKRRSKSISTIHRCSDLSNSVDKQDQNIYFQISDFSGSSNVAKSKSSTLFSKFVRERKSSSPLATSATATASACTKSIEVIRNEGPVEIVSTPAEAIGSASRTNSVYSSEFKTINSEKIYEQISEKFSSQGQIGSKIYHYNYTGSCVAIHDYTTSDSSDMYLSFSAGQEFYIIEEDTDYANSGWLLVELADRSKSGYVPQSYMDIRTFDVPVPMQSNHPICFAMIP